MSARGLFVRAVLDTNILLRAFLSHTGVAARLFRAARAERFTLLISPAIIRELRAGFFKERVRRLFLLSPQEIAGFLADVRVIAELVPGDLAVRYGSRDPKDNPILACAVEGKADFLVTDDRHDLLPMKHFHGVQIVSPTDFLRSHLERP